MARLPLIFIVMTLITIDALSPPLIEPLR